MIVYRSTMAIAICGVLLVGCDAPEQPTDLRPDGPPNVTVVTVMSDLTGSRLIETATFCRPGDDKRPTLVGLPTFTTTQVCPDDPTAAAGQAGVAEGAPPLWFVRVVFDELLDPTVEELVPGTVANTTIGTIRNTQPVTLRCQNLGGTLVDVPYDGYYAPNGNRVSWPLGPSLFVQAVAPTSVPTGAECEVQVKAMVHDKEGIEVPAEERTHKFKIGEHSFRFSDPDPRLDDGADNGEFELSPEAPVTFFFTAPLLAPNKASVQVEIFEGPNVDGGPNADVCDGGGTAVPDAEITVLLNEGSNLLMDLHVTDPGEAMNAWKPATTYRVQFGPTAKAPSSQTSMPNTDDGTLPGPDDYVLCFHTSAPA
jgi:hypothetical protein